MADIFADEKKKKKNKKQKEKFSLKEHYHLWRVSLNLKQGIIQLTHFVNGLKDVDSYAEVLTDDMSPNKPLLDEGLKKEHLSMLQRKVRMMKKSARLGVVRCMTAQEHMLKMGRIAAKFDAEWIDNQKLIDLFVGLSTTLHTVAGNLLEKTEDAVKKKKKVLNPTVYATYRKKIDSLLNGRLADTDASGFWFITSLQDIKKKVRKIRHPAKKKKENGFGS